MVSYPIENYINDKDWQRQLSSYWKKESFQELLHKVHQRRQQAVIYPPQQLWFEAFNQCPWEQVKVLILGQDPYHGPNQAHGLAFSVPQGEKLPPSLRNIYKELKSDLDIEPAFSGDLSPWAKAGVLLLNSSLTVEEGQAGAHAQWGWEGFSDWVISSLAEEKKRMVFILWGAWAQQKAALIDPQEHLIISSAHPSPLSAHRGFFGSRPFSQCNAYLEQVGKKPIRWALPW